MSIPEREKGLMKHFINRQKELEALMEDTPSDNTSLFQIYLEEWMNCQISLEMYKYKSTDHFSLYYKLKEEDGDGE